MLMQDKNNLQLADLILDWIDKHVENKTARRRLPLHVSPRIPINASDFWGIEGHFYVI